MHPSPIELSVIIPARDEEGNIAALITELAEVLPVDDLIWEVIVVDDGSVDGTRDRLVEAGQRYKNLKIVGLPTRQGKSAALAAGISGSMGSLIGMMDADLQNCPKDFWPMIRILREESQLAGVQGCRVHRQDSWAKRCAARLGFVARRLVLGDTVRDVGCGIRVLRREMALQLPLHFEGMHRFIPCLIRLYGGEVREISVDHRPRFAGHSKYHIGVVSRGICGFLDLLAVRWMIWRKREIRGVSVSNGGRLS
ncbi:MAG: glycosyltransferase family 2 protein [Terrimicrobiaceae bacterium]